MQGLIIIFCTPLVMESTVWISVLWELMVPAGNTITHRYISQLSLKAYLFVAGIQRTQQTKSQRS
jgi:hypothetical protein